MAGGRRGGKVCSRKKKQHVGRSGDSRTMELRTPLKIPFYYRLLELKHLIFFPGTTYFL